MKTTILTAIAFVFTLTVASAKNNKEVKSTTSFGSYEVSRSANEHHVAKNTEGSYTIHYSQFDAPVKVTVVREKNRKLFLVNTKGYELQYILCGNDFGVQFMDRDYATMHYNDVLQKMDANQFRHQRIITNKNKSEAEYICLIACYLPEIIK